MAIVQVIDCLEREIDVVMPQILAEEERDDILSAVDIIGPTLIGSGGRFDLIAVPHPGLTVLQLDHHGAYGMRQNKGAPGKLDCMPQGFVVADAGQW